jgi:hypothetical protein
MTTELEETIRAQRIINHARGYFAAVLDCTKYVSERNREQAISRLMKQYDADHPEYVRLKHEC